MIKFFVGKMLMKFSRYGRYADLAAAVAMLALAFFYVSAMMAVCGILSLLAFLFDLNGRVQRFTMNRMLGVKRKV